MNLIATSLLLLSFCIILTLSCSGQNDKEIQTINIPLGKHGYKKLNGIEDFKSNTMVLKKKLPLRVKVLYLIHSSFSKIREFRIHDLFVNKCKYQHEDPFARSHFSMIPENDGLTTMVFLPLQGNGGTFIENQSRDRYDNYGLGFGYYGKQVYIDAVYGFGPAMSYEFSDLLSCKLAIGVEYVESLSYTLDTDMPQSGIGIFKLLHERFFRLGFGFRMRLNY